MLKKDSPCYFMAAKSRILRNILKYPKVILLFHASILNSPIGGIVLHHTSVLLLLLLVWLFHVQDNTRVNKIMYPVLLLVHFLFIILLNTFAARNQNYYSLKMQKNPTKIYRLPWKRVAADSLKEKKISHMTVGQRTPDVVITLKMRST